MKTLTLLCFAGASAFSASLPANAQEMMNNDKAAVTPGPASSSANPATKLEPRANEILRRFDKNRDGRLDDDEKADAHEMMLQEQIAKEAPPPGAQGLAFLQELAVELFDRNHDGRIDDAERADATGFLERGDVAATQAALFTRFDRNRDGKLDDFERRESEAFAVEHRGELMQEVLLKRFDANANGRLEPEEKTAVRAAYMNTPAVAKDSKGLEPRAVPAPPAAAKAPK